MSQTPDTPTYKPRPEKITTTGATKPYGKRGPSQKSKAREAAERAVYERARKAGVMI